MEVYTPPHHRDELPQPYATHPRAKLNGKFSAYAKYQFGRLSPIQQRMGIARAASKRQLGVGSVLKTHNVIINTGSPKKVFSISPDHPTVSIADQLGQQLESALGSDSRIDLVSNKHGKALQDIHPAKIMTEVDWGNVSLRMRPDQPKRDPNLGMIHSKDSREVARAEFEQYIGSLCDAASEHVANKITEGGAAQWKEKAAKIGCRQKLTHHMARVLKTHGQKCHPKVSYGQYLMTHGVLYPNQLVDYMSYRMAHAVNDVHDFYCPTKTNNCARLKAVIKHKIKKALFCNRILRWLSERWERCYRFIRCLNGYEDSRADKCGRRTAGCVTKWHGYVSGGSSSDDDGHRSCSSSSSDDEQGGYTQCDVCNNIGCPFCGKGKENQQPKKATKKKTPKKPLSVAAKKPVEGEKPKSQAMDEYGRYRPERIDNAPFIGDDENEAGQPYSSDEEEQEKQYSDDDAIDALLDEEDPEIAGAYLDDSIGADFPNKGTDKGKGKKKGHHKGELKFEKTKESERMYEKGAAKDLKMFNPQGAKELKKYEAEEAKKAKAEAKKNKALSKKAEKADKKKGKKGSKSAKKIKDAIGSHMSDSESEDEEIAGAYLGNSESDEEIAGAYLDDSESDGEISGAYLEESSIGAHFPNKGTYHGKGKKKGHHKEEWKDDRHSMKKIRDSIDDEIAGAYLPAASVGCHVASKKKNPDSDKKKEEEEDESSEDEEFKGAYLDEEMPAASSSVASTVTATPNPIDNFHKLWSSNANKRLIRDWIGSKSHNTYVMWPDKLTENLNTPDKVQAYLVKQSIQVPMRTPLRGQTFSSIDGSAKYQFNDEETTVNGLLSSHHEIAGGASATLADFPLNEGKIFVRPYQTKQ